MISVQIENLWKEYRLGVIGSGTLASDFQSFLCRIRGKEDPNARIDLGGGGEADRVKGKRFFALRGVDLEIEEGEIVGIIGKNGAGKSTLLKILSRITKPTRGVVRAAGRTASLLEVGTGFHPELTGRENIYLNGAILGMSRREVAGKFDRIVDFSGVGEFIDTPVKRYSSGMHVRLAFAVAAHLEPDILIVDEVLAVGDADFQQKCLGRMREVSREGRTVIFVSHQMNAIESLCTRGVIMEGGRVAHQDGDIRALVRRYLVGADPGQEVSPFWSNMDGRCRNPYFYPVLAGLVSGSGEPAPFTVRNDEDLAIRIVFESRLSDPGLVFGIDVYDENGDPVFVSNHTDASGKTPPRIAPGRNEALVALPRRFLNEGTYVVKLVASLFNRSWLVNPFVDDIEFRFRIEGGLSDSPYWQKRRNGMVAPCLPWEVRGEKR